MYSVNHPQSVAYFNTKTISEILTDTGIGDSSLLPQSERNLRPDITDITKRSVFEIKPWNAQGLQEGRWEVQVYIAVLNRTAAPRYRWTRSQRRFASERAAYEAGQWVDLTEEEMQQYGGWVGQAVEEMVRRQGPDTSCEGRALVRRAP